MGADGTISDHFGADLALSGKLHPTHINRVCANLPLLHGHGVVLVRWNEPFQKLATCDADGGIFVWIQYEGRWSVELVNDRGAQVSDFTWSHDGTQALISYRDGFVLVGSVSGQRHWSSEINLESQITCGIWTPDDQQFSFGVELDTELYFRGAQEKEKPSGITVTSLSVFLQSLEEE
ncbi:UNVERIFIED_CONTAM: hypothetical protein K2H54_061532 [Gekko kuhli]